MRAGNSPLYQLETSVLGTKMLPTGGEIPTRLRGERADVMQGCCKRGSCELCGIIRSQRKKQFVVLSV